MSSTETPVAPPAPVEFPPVSETEWRSAAEALLKGAPFDKVMLTPTAEGITLQPIYRREVLEGLPGAATLPGLDGGLRGHHAEGYRLQPWEIAQELPYGDPTEFNRALLMDLARGQNCVNVLLDIATVNGRDPDSAPAGEVGACGLSLASLADIRKAFSQVLPDAVSFHFQPGCGGLPVMALFEAWLEERGVDRANVRGALNMDPLGMLSASGSLPGSLGQIYDEMAALARHHLGAMPGFTSVGVSTMAAHGAGASATQELGIALATGLAYVKALVDRGLSVDEAASQISFTFSIGGNFFMELAKFRAFRPLWARVVAALGGAESSGKARIHGRTGIYNKTRHDPYVNLLRTTTEALSGVLGGVDSLCVGAFDECLRVPDDFSRRIARNTQVILQEECEIPAVVDPAGGSWFVEWLTDQVAQKAWEEFQKIEKQGGLLCALEGGTLQVEVAKVHGGREKLLAQRRASLVGTNQYPDIGEKPLAARGCDFATLREKRAQELAEFRTGADPETDLDVMARLSHLLDGAELSLLPSMVAAVKAGATIGEITRALRAGVAEGPVVAPLTSTRLARTYEELRQAADAFKVATGSLPAIHLATCGVLRRHKARADFTRSFFATGGFECAYAEGSSDAAEIASRALASGARLVVICGHDEDYPSLVPDVTTRIKAADPGVQVLLAGFPGDHEAAYREAGLDDYIFVKSNNYEVNRRYLVKLGVLHG
ncbi:methylmalonyl-CoA mutase [Haloferula luteola]|uniref:Methylmalonyl-CoA mutase n=1 Tax=Haloferula luteola TaxID=595692 RepID=A0A840VA96_9BACT|nr:methylmalonyl-CoA mutase family protein [Haloferula luteola]MBB5352474.1 methylmalonyl-CoA mutase [Haloferula luteola]